MHIRITSEPSQLRRLLTDLERPDAHGISAPALMSVPVLDQWNRAHRQFDCLEGKVEGHPYIPDGDKILTSDIYAHIHDEVEHLVRTLSGWYRLGGREEVGTPVSRSSNIHFMEDLARLKRVVADLEKLQAGFIDPSDLMCSTELERWVPSFRDASCAEGEVEGNPDQPSGTRVKTSQIFAIVRGEREFFIRTLNRWYRLGSEGIR